MGRVLSPPRGLGFGGGDGPDTHHSHLVGVRVCVLYRQQRGQGEGRSVQEPWSTSGR